MTDFADQTKLRTRSRRGSELYATLEIGHEGTRKGITVELACESPTELLAVLHDASTWAVQHDSVFDRCNPGCWAPAIVAVAMGQWRRANIQRMHAPGRLHAALLCARPRMLEDHPNWPELVLADGSRLDIRSKTALAFGPTGEELRRYADSVNYNGSIESLFKLFEEGVIRFDDDAKLVPAFARKFD